MQAVPVEHSRMPKPHTAGTKMQTACGKKIMNIEGEKGNSITPIKQSEEASGGHTVHDYQPGCITADNVPNMTTESSPSPVKMKSGPDQGK